MNNYEKYKEQIDAMLQEELAIALVDGKPTVCDATKCRKCDMHLGDCIAPIIKWLVAEYKEPEVDWESIEINTPILVSNNGEDWYKRHFAEYKDGKVWAWDSGGTSWSVSNKYQCHHWSFTKLSEVEE